MFGLLVFFFKLFFSTFFCILFSYFILEEEENNLGVILFGILGAVLSILSSSASDSGFFISILIFSVLYFSYSSFNISTDVKKIFFIFPGLIGFLVGLGMIFETILVLLFLYFAKNNLEYIYRPHSAELNIDDENEKNIDNEK
tara:strand:- start:329 stop:757 length:429 start_codon:yes stop_codon:yes gene_type:complete